jgi:SAM-dependent methyltransferase
MIGTQVRSLSKLLPLDPMLSCETRAIMAQQTYDDAFYRATDAAAETSAQRIVPLILDLWPIGSVVDLGCARGAWLAAFCAKGIVDIFGFDGPWLDTALLKIPTDRYRCIDLAAPIKVERRFDLAISLEVAEHVAPDCAQTFVANLVSLAPLVLFSAAVPGQGGVEHVNEQWPNYWTAIFRQHGYRVLDLLRPLIWNDASIAWWYRQNLLLFASEAALADHKNLAAPVSSSEPLPLIHPELLSRVLKLARPGIGRWMKMMPDAIIRSLAVRRGRIATRR